MTKYKVLIDGYAKETDSGWLATSTTTLIEDGGRRIIVDPGINKKLLLEKLKDESFSTKDIDMVFMTHYHPDHILLVSLFENATFHDGSTIYENDLETEFDGNIPGTDIKVIATPGHAHEHASLVFESEEGTVVIAADVFWWMTNEEQVTDNYDLLMNKKDPFTKDLDALISSRKKVLEIADVIIPGHGKVFVNKFKGKK